MHWDVLQQIGLNKNEAKIYEALLDLGEGSVSEIAAAGSVNRRNVYDTLNNLQRRALVSRVRGKRQKLFRAADPKKLMHLLQQQRQRISLILPALENMYREHIPHEQAFVSRGVEGIRNFWNYVLSQNEPAYFVGEKGAWHDPRIEEARKRYFTSAKRKNISLTGIFDHEMMKRDVAIYSQYNPDKIRFFPKDYSTNATFDICGNRVILFSMVGERNIANVTIYNIISKPLADSFRTWFQLLWNNAQQLTPNQSTSKRLPVSKHSA